MSQTPSPTLHGPPLYAPPEDFFDEHITLAVDVCTLGVSPYEVLGQQSLSETFVWERDDIVAEMISTLGHPQAGWWDA